MALAVITISDSDDGESVDVKTLFEPPLKGDGTDSLVHNTAAAMVMAVSGSSEEGPEDDDDEED